VFRDQLSKIMIKINDIIPFNSTPAGTKSELQVKGSLHRSEKSEDITETIDNEEAKRRQG